MQMVGSFAEFERAMIRERTRAGLASARHQGRVGGRKPKLTTPQRREIIEKVSAGQWSNADAARLFSVHPSTITRLLEPVLKIPQLANCLSGQPSQEESNHANLDHRFAVSGEHLVVLAMTAVT